MERRALQPLLHPTVGQLLFFVPLWQEWLRGLSDVPKVMKLERGGGKVWPLSSGL